MWSLHYKGKRSSLTVSPPWLTQEYLFNKSNNYTCLVRNHDAQKIMEGNPGSFDIISKDNKDVISSDPKIPLFDPNPSEVTTFKVNTTKSNFKVEEEKENKKKIVTSIDMSKLGNVSLFDAFLDQEKDKDGNIKFTAPPPLNTMSKVQMDKYTRRVFGKRMDIGNHTREEVMNCVQMLIDTVGGGGR